MKNGLRKELILSKHHLHSDGSFNEFQVVVASHVLDTYGPTAAYRGHRTIYQSLPLFGVVYLGEPLRRVR